MSILSKVPVAVMDAKLRVPASRAADASQAALKEVESRFAAALLQAALPNSKSMFGKGLAGSVARDALIDGVAKAVAASGALGIVRVAAAGPVAAAVAGGPVLQQGVLQQGVPQQGVLQQGRPER